MKTLVDANILLDVLLEREGLVDESQAVLDWCELHPGEGWIAWHTLANLYYIGLKAAGKKEAERFVDEILNVFEVCPADSLAAAQLVHYPFPISKVPSRSLPAKWPGSSGS